MKTSWMAVSIAALAAAVLASVGTAWWFDQPATAARAAGPAAAAVPAVDEAAPTERKPLRTPERPAPGPAPAAGAGQDARFAALESRVAELESRLVALAARRESPVDAGADLEAVRDLVAAVLEEERVAEQPDEATLRAELEERRAFEAEMRAAWVAGELDLDDHDRARLLPLYLEEMERRVEVERLANERDIQPDEILTRMEAIDEWKRTELSRLFGAELGTKLMEY